jgi:dolichol-phosphate mannosyltransferase
MTTKTLHAEYSRMNWALVVPLANEENDFAPFIREVFRALEAAGSGTVYLVVDNASTDRTTELCRKLSDTDRRFITVWAPENKNLAQAYQRGMAEAWQRGHHYMIEMDAGLSHEPGALPLFLDRLAEGSACVWGSRFIPGGAMEGPALRRLLSKGGTAAANLLLGTSLHDMTSGFQGFSRDTVARFMQYPMKSQSHFYQTELRYLLRRHRFSEVPIRYRAPSPRVSFTSLLNSLASLMYYAWRRFTFRPVSL